MFSLNHPKLPTLPERQAITHYSWEDVLDKVFDEDMPIIQNFMKEPNLSDMLLKVFKGELWFGNASDEERDVVHDIIAGLVDGDGTISGSVEKQVKVKFVLAIGQHAKDLQVCYLPLFWFRVGSVYVYDASEHTSMRSWRADLSNAVWVCNIIAPKLVLKKRQAELFAATPYIMFKDTETYAVSRKHVKDFDTIEQAFQFLGAPTSLMEAVPNMFELTGEVYYFNPEGDDGSTVRWIRKLVINKTRVKYQVMVASPGDILVYPSRTIAAEQSQSSQPHVTSVSNGNKLAAGQRVFWAHSRWAGEAFKEKSRQDREMRKQVLEQVKALNHEDRPVDEQVMPSHAYMAGFFAAEGSVYPANKTGAVLTVGQKHRGICDVYQRVYDGIVRYSGTVHKGQQYQWTIYQIDSVRSLFQIWQPYLVAKLRDFDAVEASIGLLPKDRLQTIHEAREQHLPDSMKTERRDKKRGPRDMIIKPKRICSREELA